MLGGWAPDPAGSGLLTRDDRALLAAYCVAWSRWVEAERHVAAYGTIVEAPRTGLPMANPHLAIANKAMEQVTKIGSEFGLTPASRARIGIHGEHVETESRFSPRRHDMGPK
ncbi:MAG: phage terminase small subunit P27 family [Alphaproteobacteria bacterium]|nr:phage terminase small subunit P27 family [Alphaproteobacteria bacterium]